MVEQVEVETESGPEYIELREGIDQITQNRVKQALNVTTKVRDGEMEHIIEDSVGQMEKIARILLNRALERSPTDISKDALTQSGAETVIRFYRDALEDMGLMVKKK